MGLTLVIASRALIACLISWVNECGSLGAGRHSQAGISGDLSLGFKADGVLQSQGDGEWFEYPVFCLLIFGVTIFGYRAALEGLNIDGSVSRLNEVISLGWLRDSGVGRNIGGFISRF